MLKKVLPLFLLLVCTQLLTQAQMPVVDNKGSKIVVDSSKWRNSGINIYNKNPGNTGIGTISPLYKLDVFSTSNPLRLTGLLNGAGTDSLLVSQNGVVKKIAPVTTYAINRVDSTTASNGLNLFGKDVRLGGNLTQATSINNNGNSLTIATNGNPLNISGLNNGVSNTDSLVVIQNGLIRKIAPVTTFAVNRVDSTTASNGLNLVGKDVRIGGNLTQPTTIATSGQSLNITGLPVGTVNDSLLTVDPITGQLRLLNPSNFKSTLVELFDAAGTQVLTPAFANLNLATTSQIDPGYTAAAGAITVSLPGTYKITLRATVQVTTNQSSGGEFRLTLGGTAIPGTLGYTYQHNANRPYGTVTIVKVVTLTAGSVIAAQGRRYSVNGNLRLVAYGSTLLIEKIK